MLNRCFFPTLLSSFFALSLLSIPSGASGGSDTSSNAAIGLGALAGIGLITEWATRSEVSVKVDVYRETLPLHETAFWFNDSSVDNTVPFKLGGPPAIQRLINRQDDPTKTPTALNIRRARLELAPYVAGIRLRSSARKSLCVGISRLSKLGNHWEQLNHDFKEQQSAANRVISGWDDFEGYYQAANMDNNLSVQELDALRQKLSVVKEGFLSLRDFRFSDVYLYFLHARIAAIDSNILPEPALVAGQWVTLDDIAALLDDVRKHYSANRLNTPQVVIFNSTLQSFGLDLTWETLKSLNGKPEILERLQDAPLSVVGKDAQAAEGAITRVFNGFTSSPNIGPLLNEMMQQVLSRSDIIDRMLNDKSKSKWAPFTYAQSSARLGNHDACIYMENGLTPILKFSEYDPNMFLVAHGALYHRAFQAIAGVYGLPKLEEVDTPTTFTFANQYMLHARMENAVKTNKAIRAAKLETLETIMKSDTAIHAAEPDWTNKKDAAITELKSSLEAAAQALEK